MSIKEIFKDMLGELMIALGTILALILVFGLGFWPREFLSEEIAASIYILAWIMIVFVSKIINSLLIVRKLKIRPGQSYYVRNPVSFYEGFRHYATLEISVPEEWEITDCYATVESIVPIFYHGEPIIEEEFAEWFSSVTQPEYKRLTWKSPFTSDDCKVSVGDNSSAETLHVAQINKGAIISDGQEIPMNSLEFSLCSSGDKVIKSGRMGLYEFLLVLHWRNADGRKMMPKKFKGYLYARTDKQPYLMIGEGDYRKNPDIPKPIKKEEENEQT